MVFFELYQTHFRFLIFKTNFPDVKLAFIITTLSNQKAFGLYPNFFRNPNRNCYTRTIWSILLFFMLFFLLIIIVIIIITYSITTYIYLYSPLAIHPFWCVNMETFTRMIFHVFLTSKCDYRKKKKKNQTYSSVKLKTMHVWSIIFIKRNN